MTTAQDELLTAAKAAVLMLNDLHMLKNNTVMMRLNNAIVAFEAEADASVNDMANRS